MAERHPNITIYTRALRTFNKNDLNAGREFFSENVVYRFPGRSPIAGEYRGIEQFFKVLQLLKDMTGGTLTIEPKIVLANDQAVMVYTHTTAQREGKTLDTDQVNLYRFNEERKIFEGRIIPFDLYAFDEFWL